MDYSYFLLLIIMLAIPAVMLAFVFGGEDPHEREYSYSRGTHLTHFPDGRVLREDEEY
jgi:hypothetical protein